MNAPGPNLAWQPPVLLYPDSLSSRSQSCCLANAAPMLDALAAGLKECKLKPIVGPKLQLDAFLDGMLRSRISRRIMAEQVCLVPKPDLLELPYICHPLQ